MANATVEKLKNLGLRHGEKLALTLATVACCLCLGRAATTPTITTTPKQVTDAASQADSNLNRRVSQEQLSERIVEAGIGETNFSKEVEEQAKSLLVADDYRPLRSWVMPEPGAGYIRDNPKLIAVTELYAYPGRGGALTYALDEKGNKILDDGTEDPSAKDKSGLAGRRRMAMQTNLIGMRVGRNRLSQAEYEKEIEKQRLQAQKKITSKLAGSANTAEEKKKAAEEEKLAKEANIQAGPFKEVLKGLRWVVLTGVLDHAKLLENYREALKNPTVAHPYYKRLNVQRQVLQADGNWSDWKEVASEKNLEILDNLPEADDEMTPETVRPTALVDPLPFLKAGYWEKVHIASLVPKEQREIAPAQQPMPGMMGGMDDDDPRAMMRGMGGMMGRGGRGMAGGGMAGPAGGMFMEDEDGMRGMGGMMGMGRGGMMGMGGAEATNFWKSEEPKVMVRALDFTVTPDTTYRYRVQLVVWNPNRGRDDLSPEASKEKDKLELVGPWSDPTSPVVMPADISPYAIATSAPTPKADSKVRFQLIRFEPQNGATVTRNLDYGPGEIIGEQMTAQIPTSDGTGPTTKNIDFTSHQVLLDVIGKPQPLPAGVNGAPLGGRAVALLVRPDGAMVIHNQADDESNEVRKDTVTNYQRELDESKQERKSSMGAGYQGMGGGGMMPGGMGRQMMGGAGGGRR